LASSNQNDIYTSSPLNISAEQLGLERYWYWVIGYWAIFTDIG